MAAAPFSVRSNVKQFSRGLTDIQKRRIPWSTKEALNDTIGGGRKRIVERTWPRSVTVRNRRFMGTAMRREFATIRKPKAALFDRLGRGFLTLQAEGGTKRPAGAHIAVPLRKVRRTAAGRVPKGQQPSAVLRRRNAFIGTVKSANPAIITHTAAGGLNLLYTLVRSARVRKSFRFYEDMTATSARQFPRHLARRFAQALRTAR